MENNAPQTIEISPFRAELGADVCKLVLGIQRDEFGVQITVEDQPDILDISSSYQRGNGNFWCAIAGGTVVGTVGMMPLKSKRAVLRKMFVHPAFRGRDKGISQGLLNALLDWVKEHDIEEVFLGTIHRYHAALKFYERNGFQPITLEELPADFPRMAVDDRFYKRTLS